MPTLERTHYEVLGVPQNATETEIKRAWAQKIRQHPPDRDPEENQRINVAKQTLLDAKARARYDAHLAHGPEIEALMEQVGQALEAKETARAARLLRQAVALSPEDDFLRLMWGLVVHQAGDTAAAIDILQRLVQREPDVALYRYHLATVMRDYVAPSGATYRYEALKLFQEAVAMEPHNAEYHIALARCYTRMDRFAEAEQAIEAAIQTDGKVDVQDLDALFELPVIHVLAGEAHRVRQDADRIVNVIAGLSEEIHEFCGFRFAQLAAELADLKAYKAAIPCAEAAVRCAPKNSTLKELRTELRRLRKLEQELERLARDNNVPQPLKVLVGNYGLLELRHTTEDQARPLIENAARALEWMPAHTLRPALDHLHTHYPQLYNLLKEPFDELRGSHAYAPRTPTTVRPTASTTTSGSPGDCCLPTLLLLTGVIALLSLLF